MAYSPCPLSMEAASTLHSGNPFVMLKAIQNGLLRIGVLGASMAQNGGCFDALKRCGSMDGRHLLSHTEYDALQHTWITKKENRLGFIVDFAQRLQKLHSGLHVKIHNAAVDATPIQAVLDCFHSHLPKALDVAILEPGSMAKYATASDLARVVETVRTMDGSPHIVIVLFHEWLHQRSKAFYDEWEDTPWLRMERAALALSYKYNLTCLSPRRALYAYVNRSHERLYKYVGDDGLHIVNSRYGISYVSDMLWNWYLSINTMTYPAPDAPVRVANAPPLASCYRFSSTPQRFRLIDWSTAACPACNVTRPTSCNHKLSRAWSFCKKSDHGVKNRKTSPAMVASHPGAILRVEIDTTPHAEPLVLIEYLTSFVNVGRVQFSCEAGCKCKPGTIDAFNASLQNSIFMRYPIRVTRARACKMRFRLEASVTPYFRMRWLLVTDTNSQPLSSP